VEDNNMQRYRSIIMATLAVLLILSACTGVPAAPTGGTAATAIAPAESGAEGEVTTITWLTLDWNGVEDVIAVFEAENPDIHVEAEMVPFNSLFEQIQVRLGASSPEPDVISVDVPLVASYGLRNWLLPLDDVFSEAEVQDWLEAAVEAGSYQGELLAAPVSTSTQLLFYNADLFKKAGITPPGEDERWTMQYIAEIAPQLTMDEDGDGVTDIWGFTWEQTNRIYQLQPMPVSLGGQAIGDDGLTVDGIINSQPWIDAFTYYANMFNTLKAAPRDDTIPASDLFAAGKLAMYIAGPWNINNLIRADVDFEWGVSRHPYFEGGEIVTPTGSWHIGVNRNSQNADAATRFVHWISTGKGAETWWRMGSGDFPAQKSVLALFGTDEEFAQPPQSFLKVAADEATVNPVPRPVTPGYLEYEQILQNTFDDIRNGANVEEALNLAVERITSEMEKYTR
jgi:ABC-type glycerol-3-phosphate transport system substrate-binding protein